MKTRALIAAFALSAIVLGSGGSAFAYNGYHNYGNHAGMYAVSPEKQGAYDAMMKDYYSRVSPIQDKLNAKGIFLGANAFGIIEKLEGENATDFLAYIREHMNREDCCVCWRHTLATFRGDFKQFLVFVRMFEDLVSNLLSTYLGDYLEGLSKNDLKISLWKGDVDFKNLVSGASCA